MRLGLTSILVLSFAFGLPLAQAQYVEIYRLDNLMKELPESQHSQQPVIGAGRSCRNLEAGKNRLQDHIRRTLSSPSVR